MLPLLPAFQGEVGGDGGNAIHAILHWEYKSICQGENSLLQRLKTEAGSKLILTKLTRTYFKYFNKVVKYPSYTWYTMLPISSDQTVTKWLEVDASYTKR